MKQEKRNLLNLRGTSRKRELMLLVANVSEVLKKLDQLVKKYQGLARRERRIWNQLRLATEDLDKIRNKLTFHVTAINAFTSSLSYGTLTRIETVLLELVSEVREGRRPPSFASIHETNDGSVWSELESELAEDGISKTDVAKHKDAIKTFVQSLLEDPNEETMSLLEIASTIEYSDEDGDLESVSQRLPNVDSAPRRLTRASTFTSVGDRSLLSTDNEQYESAEEEFSEEDGSISATTNASQAPLEAAARSQYPLPKTSQATGFGGESGRKGFLRAGLFAEPSNKQWEATEEARQDAARAQIRPAPATTAVRAPLGEHLNRLQIAASTKSNPSPSISEHSPPKSQMILIIDPFHSSVSRLAHAYLQSLVTSNGLVREHIDTVSSTGWRFHESDTPESISKNELMRELLSSRNLPILNLESDHHWRIFRFKDLFEFDHIVCIDSPSFPQYLEDNIEGIAKLQAKPGTERKTLAKLIRYDRLIGRQIPKDLLKPRHFTPEMLRAQGRLELEDIFKSVQRFMLDFLEREYGLKKTSKGFDRTNPGGPRPFIYVPTPSMQLQH